MKAIALAFVLGACTAQPVSVQVCALQPMGHDDGGLIYVRMYCHEEKH